MCKVRTTSPAVPVGLFLRGGPGVCLQCPRGPNPEGASCHGTSQHGSPGRSRASPWRRPRVSQVPRKADPANLWTRPPTTRQPRSWRFHREDGSSPSDRLRVPECVAPLGRGTCPAGDADGDRLRAVQGHLLGGDGWLLGRSPGQPRPAGDHEPAHGPCGRQWGDLNRLSPQFGKPIEDIQSQLLRIQHAN